MKLKSILFCLFIGCSLALNAQSISVKSFKLLDNDLSAITHGTEVKDQNGQTCALIKVETVETGFTFDFGLMAPIKTEQHPGEIWVYVPFGVKRVTIQHSRLGIIRDYAFPMSVEKGRTYLMQLSTGKVTNVVKEQYLTFQITPSNATLEVDGEIWPVSWEGTARKKVNEGSYSYKVQAPNYESEEGTVDVADTATLVTVRLKAIPVAPQKPVERRVTFVTANAAYSFAPQASFGLSVGQVKRFGWFVSMMTNGNFSGFSYAGDCDAQGYTSEGYLLAYSGEVSKMRLSVIGGGVIHVAKPLYARVGIGYGNRTLRWKTESGKWMRNADFSTAGLDLSAGLQLHLKGFVVSTEAVTTNFKTLEAKIGLGYSF